MSHRLVGCGATTLIICLTAPSATTGLDVETPLRLQAPAADGSIRTRLDLDAIGPLTQTRQCTMRAFPIDATTRLDLSLRRVEVFAPGARFVVVTDQGEQTMPAPDVTMFAGNVVGLADSEAFLSFSPHGGNGWVRTGGTTYIVTSGPGGGRDVTIFNPATAPAGSLAIEPLVCQSDLLARPPLAPAAPPAPTGRGRSSICKRALVAVETDSEYTQLFGGDASASAAYATTLLGAVSSVYERDVAVTLQIVFLRLWTTPADPWDQGDSRNQLFQFRDYWNANMTGIQRNAATFLSGRSLGGGIAYLPGLCQSQYDYSLESHLNGFFPMPLQNNQSQNWDPMVCAHELGHNFGAPHTHCMSPPIDTCAGTGYDCPNTRVCINNGTIMSYCHLCPGGVANVRMEFHARTINEAMLPYLTNQVPCDLSVPCGLADCDGNGAIELADVSCFTDVLLGVSADPMQFSRCDMNVDGRCDGADIPLFVYAILTGP